MYSIVNDHKNTKIMNLVIAVLGTVVAFAVLFSAIFISLETFHDCDNENCPICEMLQLCEKTIEQFSDGGIFIAFVAPLLFMVSKNILALT